MLPLLHGFHNGNSGHEWVLPLILLGGTGTALIARWLGRMLRGDPSDHDEPV